MASLNKVILIGNLGRDPETRTLPSGETVCNVSIATTETWKDRNTGTKQEATEWHRVSMFGRLAEIAAQYLRKGSQVYIEGSLRTRKWTDQSGQERYSTEIRATEMKMLGGRNTGSSFGGDEPMDDFGGGAPVSSPPAYSRPAPSQPAPRPAQREDTINLDDEPPF